MITRTDGRWHHHTRLDSTQAELKRLLAADSRLAPWTVVTAQYQDQGVGRHGRSWITTRDALAISVLLRPQLASSSLPWLGATAGLAMVDALTHFGLGARIKWPNDIVVNGRKVCGLIAHAVYADMADPAIVVGLGLNMCGARAEFEAAGLPQASSLEAECGVIRASALDIAEQWLAWLNNRLASLTRHGPESQLADYRLALSDTGRDAVVRTADDRLVHGRLMGVNERGELVVQTIEGITETVLAGIVEWQ